MVGGDHKEGGGSDMTVIAFRADADLLRLIEDNRDDLSASQFIRRAIKWAIKEGLDADD